MAGLIESITLGKYLFSLPECGGRRRGRGGGGVGCKRKHDEDKAPGPVTFVFGGSPSVCSTRRPWVFLVLSE